MVGRRGVILRRDWHARFGSQILGDGSRAHRPSRARQKIPRADRMSDRSQQGILVNHGALLLTTCIPFMISVILHVAISFLALVRAPIFWILPFRWKLSLLSDASAVIVAALCLR